MSLTKLLRQSSLDGKEAPKKKAPRKSSEEEGFSLKKYLQSGRLKLSRARTPYPQGKTFRPSSLSYPYCRRSKVAQLAGKIELYDKPPAPKLQLIFDMGHAIHDIIQGYFWDMGVLKGSYKCLKCDKIYHDLVSPDACPSGIKSHERKHLKYKEVRMVDEEHRINGRCDGIILVDGVEHLMDIKSIQNRTEKTPDQYFCFEDLEDGPKSDHVVQLQLYMWISGIPNGHLLYVAKNTHMIKTFNIPYDFSILEPHLKEIEELIALAERWEAGEKIKLPDPCSRADCSCQELVC